jgi:hypothetical protein
MTAIKDQVNVTPMTVKGGNKVERLFLGSLTQDEESAVDTMIHQRMELQVVDWGNS